MATEILLTSEKMSSLDIAELIGKQHSNVLRDIRNILEQLEDRHQFNFELMFRISKLGNGAERKDPYYLLTKKDCLLLASGYDANLRARIINRWEELEKERQSATALLPNFNNPAEAARAWADQYEKNKLLQDQNEQQRAEIELKDGTIERQTEQLHQAAPKVDYYDQHLQSVNTITTTQVAKQIGLDARKLNHKLRELGIIYRQSSQWLLHHPYSTWGLHATRTQTFTRSDGSTGTDIYTVWKQKGARFIIALFENGWNVRKAINQIKGQNAA